MATIKQFEDILAWQKARALVRDVYEVFSGCTDRGFKDQIQRAAVSVMSNIAEGFESGSQRGFIHYLYIAKGSAGEVRAQLYAAHDIGYLNIERFNNLKAQAEEVSKLLSSLIKGVKKSELPGLQYKGEEKNDPLEILTRQNPELHQRFYGNKDT